MKVRDAMAHTITVARPGQPIRAVARMMKDEDTGFVPVVERDQLIGVVTDRDIVVRCLAEAAEDVNRATVDEVMTRSAETVSPEDDLSRAADLMENDEVRRLAVVENGRLVGVLSHGNLVQATRGQRPAVEATTAVTRGA